MARAAGAEGIALIECHLGILAQPLGRLRIATDGGIGKIQPQQVGGIRFAGLEAGNALGQLLHQPIASPAQVGHLFIEEIAALAVRGLRGQHAQGARAILGHARKAVPGLNIGRVGENHLGALEPGGIKGLRRSGDRDGALCGHRAERGYRDMPALIDQRGVDFIGQDARIILLRQLH